LPRTSRRGERLAQAPAACLAALSAAS
jgi:hypothetical protein